jgi:predicted ABC-type ATPase
VVERSESAQIYVLAGTNGGGKSSVGGAMFLRQGTTYFNPDEAAKRILAANPGVTQDIANGAAWFEGKRLLQRAIDEGLAFGIETTLGGRTITAMLESALSGGAEVRVWYVGLSSPELHIARVKARVAAGGHDIPEEKIRERYDRSRVNLLRLLPKLTELRMYDNSEEADPAAGTAPQPRLILHMEQGRVMDFCDLTIAPEWTKPILAAAIKLKS